jgi:hypothetical protein
MSKKFTNVQCSYFTYEHKTLGAIEALKKWDNELLGLTEIQIITDHEALKTFMLKAHSRLPNMLVTMVFMIPIKVHSHSGITKPEC